MKNHPAITAGRLVAVVLALTGGFGAAGEARAQSLTVRGLLTNAASPARPIPGALVTVRSTNGSRIVTAATGTDGRYQAVFSAPPSPVASIGDVLSFGASRNGVALNAVSVNLSGVAQLVLTTGGDLTAVTANLVIPAPPPSASLTYFVDGIAAGPGLPHTAVKAALLTVRATFDAPLGPAPKLSITGPSPGTNDVAASSMTPSPVASQARTVWFLSKQIQQGADGLHTVALTNVEDLALNGLSSTPSNNTFTVDTRAPTLSAAVAPTGPLGDVTAGTLTITATFSEDTNPLATPTVSVIRSGTGSGNTLPPTPMSRVSARIWTSSAYGVSAQNTVAGITDGDAILVFTGAEDLAGNASQAASSGATFTIDTVGPSVALTYSRDPARVSTGALTVTATFSDAGSDTIPASPRLTVSSANPTAPTTLFDTPMIRAGATTFTAVLDVASGVNGAFTASVSGATDGAGNPNAAATNTSLVVDTQRPSVTSVTVPGQTSTAIATGPVQVRVRFSEPMAGTPTIALALGATTLLPASALVPIEGTITWVSPSFTIPPGQLGNVSAQVSSGADLAGNTLFPFSSANVFAADTVRPTVASVAYSRDPAGPGALAITATFSEPLATPPTLAIDRPTFGAGPGDLAPTAMSATAPSSVWTLTYTVLAASAGGAQDGLAQVSIAGGLDPAGNTAVTTASGFSIDTQGPTATYRIAPVAAATCSQSSAPFGTGPLVITARFSEPVASTPTVTVDRPGTGNDSTASMVPMPPLTPLGATGFAFVYDVARDNTSTVFDGLVSFTVSGAADAAGNAAGPPAGSTFRVDTVPPEACVAVERGRRFDCSSAGTSTIVTAGPICLTATFTEPIVAGCSPEVVFQTPGSCSPGAGALRMAPTARPDVWTFCGSIPARCNSCPAGEPVTLTVAVARDASGNEMRPARVRFVVDDVAPTLTRLVTSARTAHVPAGPLDLTATFNEELVIAPAITINRPPSAELSAGDVVDQAMARVAPGLGSGGSACPTTAATWTFRYTVTPEQAPGALDAEPGCSLTRVVITARDAAGNVAVSRPALADASQPAVLGGSATCAGFQIDTQPPVLSFTFGRADAPAGPFAQVDPDFVRQGFLAITATFADSVAPAPAAPLALTATGGATAAVNDFAGVVMTQTRPGTFVLVRPIATGDDGIFTLSLETTDLAGNAAALPGRRAFGVDTVFPLAPALTLFPARPVGASVTARPVDLADRSALGAAIGAGPVDVRVTFNEPILVTSTVAGVLPVPAAPRFDLARPRGGTPATAVTTLFLVPTSAPGATSATTWTTRVVDVPRRGLPSFEDGVSSFAVSGAVDRAGNAFAGRVFQAVIDTVAPLVRLSGLTGTLTPGNRVRISGSVQDVTRTALTVSIPGTGLTTTFTVSPAFPGFDGELGPLPVPAPATLGGLRVEVVATDLAGNTSLEAAAVAGLDTDGDGMTDDFESAATLARDGSSSVTALEPGADDDGDGLSNLSEFRARTDPIRRDTDDDGVDDATELADAARGAANPLEAADNRPVARVARAVPASVAPQLLALDGRASSDPKGRALGYRWTTLTAPAGALPIASGTVTTPVAVARLTAAGQYQFVLTVGNGSAFRSPPSTTVSVTVEDLAPRAVVPPPQVFEAAGFPILARLDASASTDENGPVTLAYSWRLASNPGAGAALEGDLTGPAPLLRVSLPGAYGAEVTVSSPASSGGAPLTAVATAVVIAAGPLTPGLATPGQPATAFAQVARAGLPQLVVTTGPETTVDVPLAGRDSVDPNNPTTSPLRPSLDFTWSQLSGPAQAQFLPDARGLQEGSADRSVDPRVRLFAPGRYVFQLSVARAGAPGSAGVPDRVTIDWVRLAPGSGGTPLADAGLDRVIADFDAAAPPSVELNGTGSRPDPRTGGTLTYRWTQVPRSPFDGTPQAALDDPAAARPQLVPPAPGSYRFRLVVSDSKGLSSLPDEVLVQVRPRTRATFPKATVSAADGAGTLSFARPARILAGNVFPTVTLSAKATGQTPLTYRWRQVFEGSTAAPVTLLRESTQAAAFRPTVSGNYRFAVTVSDGTLSSETALTVPVDDLRPGGNAGVTPVVKAPATVEVPADREGVAGLDAGASFDRDGTVSGRRAATLTYLWRQLEGPSLAGFDRTAARPAVPLPAGTFGRYGFECVLDDGQDAIVSDPVSFAAVPVAAPPAIDPRTGRPAASQTAATGDSGGGGCDMGPAGSKKQSLSSILWMLAMLWIFITGRRRAEKRHYTGPRALTAALLVAGSLALPGSVCAQGFFRVDGILSDASGPRQDAQVVATNVNTSQSRTFTTGSSGAYSVVFTNVTTNDVISFFVNINGRSFPTNPASFTVSASERQAGVKSQDLTVRGPVTTLTYSSEGSVFRAGTLTITASFSEAVSTPSISIDLSPAGLSANDVGPVGMTHTNGASVATFSLTLSTSSGDGPATVDITGAQGFSLPHFDVLPPEDDGFTVDTARPQFVSFTSSATTTAGTAPVAITVTFGEPMASAPVLRVTAPEGHNSFTQQMLPADSTGTTWFLPYNVLSAPEFPATTGGAVGVVSFQLVSATDPAGNTVDVSTPPSGSFTFDNRRPRASLTVPPAGNLPSRLRSGVPVTFQLATDEPIDVNFPPAIRLDQNGLIDFPFRVMTPSTAGATASVWTTTFTPRAQDTALGVLDGAATVQVRGGRDVSGNESLFEQTPGVVLDSIGPIYSLSYNGKTTSPFVTTGPLSIVAVASDAGTALTPTISIVPVLDAGTSFGAMTRQTGGVFLFETTVTPADGDPSPVTRTVTVFGSLTDDVGNPAQPLVNDTFVTDTRPLTATLTRSPSAARIGPCPLVLTATFDRPVVAAPTVLIAGGTTSATVLALTTMSGSAPGTVFTATASLPAGNDGNFVATVAGPRGATLGGASDVAGNATTAVAQFAVDSKQPTVELSFSRGNPTPGTPAGSPLLLTSGPVTITATFAEAVTTATTALLLGATCLSSPGDLATTSLFLTADGPGTANDRARLALRATSDARVWVADSYSITVTSASAPSDGAISFGVGGAADLAGNLSLPVDVTSSAAVADTVPPVPAVTASRTSFPVTTGPIRFVGSGPYRVVAVMSEPLSGTAPTLALTGLVTAGTGSGGALGLTTAMSDLGDGRSFQASLDGTAAAVLSIRVSGGADAAGNAGAAVASTLAFDGVRPTAAISTSSGSPGFLQAGPAVITATFSEPPLAAPALRIARADGGRPGVNSRLPASMTTTADPLVFLLSTEILAGDDGPFRLELVDVTDVAGNALDTVSGAEVAIDATPPSVSIGGIPGPVRPGVLRLVATFSEPLAASPTIAISGPRSGSTTNTLATTSWDPTTESTVYVRFHSVGVGDDGTFDVRVGNMRDLAGNAVAVTTAARFVADSVAPVASIAFSRGNPLPAPAGPVAVTVTFGEPVSPVPASMTIARALSGGGQQTYVVKLSPGPTTASVVGTLQVTHVAGARQGGDPATVVSLTPLGADAAGNLASAGGTLAVTLDTVAPVLDLQFDSAGSGAVGAGPVRFEVTSQELLATTPVLSLLPPGRAPVAGGPTALSTGGISADITLTIPAHRPPDAIDGEYLALVTGGTDLAGNVAARGEFSFLVDTRSPELVLREPVSGFFTSGALRVAGTATDATTVTLRFTFDGAATIFPTTLEQPRTVQSGAGEPSPQTFGADLAAGLPGCAQTTRAAAFSVVAVDAAGNESTRIVRSVVFDTDGDGLPDSFECENAGSTTALDASRDDDGDGLVNLQEFLAGTRPSEPDTDRDGVMDGDELQGGSSPTDPLSTPAAPIPGTTPRAPLVATASGPSAAVAPQRLALQGTASRALTSAIRFAWSVVSAPGAEAGAIAADSIFASTRTRATCFPQLTVPGAYVFRVTVTDSSGTSPESATADVTVQVSDVAPVAVITPGSAPAFADLSSGPVVLSFTGSGSSDANGDAVSFTWAARDGNSSAPSTTGVTGLGFVGSTSTADVQVRLSRAGAYELELTVASTAAGATALTSSSRVRIVATAGGASPPIARAGTDRTLIVTAASVDVLAQLFGRDSVDPAVRTTDPLRGSLSFRWRQTGGPSLGGAPFLPDARGRLEGGDGARSVDPQVRITAPGRYRFALTVSKATDPASVSLPDEVELEVLQLVSAAAAPPSANAGANRVLAVFDPANPQAVELDGSGSRSPVDPPANLTFDWRQARLGAADPVPAVALANAATSRPSFVPTTQGDYEFELVVADRSGRRSLPDRVRVRIVNGTDSAGGNRATGIQLTGAEAVVLASQRRVTFDSPASLEDSTLPTIQLRASAAVLGSGPVPAYRWQQLREGSTAPEVELAAASTSTASFTPTRAGAYRFLLQVSSGAFNATTAVDVPVDDLRSGGNSGVTPRVSGPLKVVLGGSGSTRVRLDASGSFDRDRAVSGRIAGRITYFWTQLAGPSRLAFDATVSALDLLVPAGQEGDYLFEVALDDGQDIVTRTVGFTTLASVLPAPAPSTAPAAQRGVATAPGTSGGCGLGGAGGALSLDLLPLLIGLGLALAVRPAHRTRPKSPAGIS
ncbi:MAG: hypothetical protein HY816_19175 [Candidatus Wallbacteria bacterium]|nr:hypothetical protein [Candidatus Wallbacteria bacterium]